MPPGTTATPADHLGLEELLPQAIAKRVRSTYRLSSEGLLRECDRALLELASFLDYLRYKNTASLQGAIDSSDFLLSMPNLGSCEPLSSDRPQQREPLQQELELLGIVQRHLPRSQQQRWMLLRQKLEHKTLTQPEHQEFLTYSDLLELTINVISCAPDSAMELRSAIAKRGAAVTPPLRRTATGMRCATRCPFATEWPLLIASLLRVCAPL